MKGKKFLFGLGGGLLLLMGWMLHQHWREGLLYLPSSFEINRVERIQLGKKGSPALDSQFHHLITLVKAKRTDYSDWRIPDLSNAPADEQKIERLLKEITRSKGKLVGRGPSLFSNFGLRNEEAFQISLFDANWTPILSLLIGVKKEGTETLVREPGSDRVYRIDSNLLEAMGIQGDLAHEKPSYDFWIKGEGQS